MLSHPRTDLAHRRPDQGKSGPRWRSTGKKHDDKSTLTPIPTLTPNPKEKVTIYSLRYGAIQSGLIAVGMTIPSAMVAVTAFGFQLAHGNSAYESMKFGGFAFVLMFVLLWIMGSIAGLRAARKRCAEVGVTFDQLGRLSIREMKRFQAERRI